MENFLEALIPLVAVAFVFGIPIVAILTSHQRKMAELMRDQQGGPALLQELQVLRYESAQLRDKVNQMQIQMDTMQLAQRNDPTDALLGQRQQQVP